MEAKIAVKVLQYKMPKIAVKFAAKIGKLACDIYFFKILSHSIIFGFIIWPKELTKKSKKFHTL